MCGTWRLRLNRLSTMPTSRTERTWQHHVSSFRHHYHHHRHLHVAAGGEAGAEARGPGVLASQEVGGQVLGLGLDLLQPEQHQVGGGVGRQERGEGRGRARELGVDIPGDQLDSHRVHREVTSQSLYHEHMASVSLR